jgi:hypothetical protein
MSNTKKAPISDYNDANPIYVDDLTLINETGAVTHLKFTTTMVETYESRTERRVTAHLIIPNEARIKIAKALLRQGDLRVDATDHERDGELSLH